MVIKDLEGGINVVQAAKQRIINCFNTGLEVKLSVSGGKDSICLSYLIINLIQEGRIDSSQLTVQFIDEEAIFDDVEEAVLKLRKEFILLGAKFEWFCIQVMHYNCLNSLSNDEVFITWDEFQKDNWVRPMQKFAIKNHPLLNERRETYQTFLDKTSKGCIRLIGIRAAESLMRRKSMAAILSNSGNNAGINGSNGIFPIYDWQDDDVWLYIKKNKLDFPETYLHLYQIGGGRRDMRISQFFSIDTAKVLVNLNEHQPGLMARVIKREPNAYIASLYWDSELFRRSRKKTNKKEEEVIEYKKIVLDLLSNIDKNFESPIKRKTAKGIRTQVLKLDYAFEDEHYKLAYQILMAGDPKSRATRALTTNLYTKYHSKGGN